MLVQALPVACIFGSHSASHHSLWTSFKCDCSGMIHAADLCIASANQACCVQLILCSGHCSVPSWRARESNQRHVDSHSASHHSLWTSFKCDCSGMIHAADLCIASANQACCVQLILCSGHCSVPSWRARESNQRHVDSQFESLTPWLKADFHDIPGSYHIPVTHLLQTL